MTTQLPNVVGLRLTINPSSEIWQVPIASSEFTVLLIGWVTREAPVDAGVPREAAQILSESLTSLAVLTFLHSVPASTTSHANQWVEVSGAWTTVLMPPRATFGQQRPLPLVSTRDPRVAERLFSAEPFDWTQQGQVALLTDGRQEPPRISYDFVEQCFHRRSLSDVLHCREVGLLGLLYPAVDGDFAALISAGAEFIEQFSEELRRACDAAQISFAIISEDEFKRMPNPIAPRPR
jgi:hypothetical protein